MCFLTFINDFSFKLRSFFLLVKAWMHEREMFGPWNINCHVCECPETIENVLIDCRGDRIFRDALKRTLKEELYKTPYTMFNSCASAIYYNVWHINCNVSSLNVSSFSIWKSRMAVKHGPPTLKSVRVFLMNIWLKWSLHWTSKAWGPYGQASSGAPSLQLQSGRENVYKVWVSNLLGIDLV